MKRNKGFTIIEVTIVVAIIGILVAIAIASGTAAKKNARDNQRKTDIRLLQVKLEAYREQFGAYPISLDGTTPPPSLVSKGLISSSVLPKDPTNNGGGYQYVSVKFSSGNCDVGAANYYLHATLENKNNDINTGTNIDYSSSSGFSVCSGSFPTPFTQYIYDVTSPI